MDAELQAIPWMDQPAHAGWERLLRTYSRGSVEMSFSAQIFELTLGIRARFSVLSEPEIQLCGEKPALIPSEPSARGG